MSETKFSEAQAAEVFLKSRLRTVRDETKKTGKYATASGRRMMLNRQRNFIGVFMELNPEVAAIPGVALNTKSGSPGHYVPGTPRAASVKGDARLGIGHHAYYVRCDSMVALQQLVQWYERH